tara:strand:+ start:73643 stop:75946 length:2304 start_codon:yes stop_codon:yes gene_type:complete
MKQRPIDNTTVQTHGVQDSVKFGIKQSGLAHIFNVLRNQLYSDKTLAVIREYSCNAYDAHVEAGKPDEPIVVTLPNRMNPVFKVRDYGLALSPEEIQEVYAFYGESTKRNTNDQIGQLGLGSKSAFAYGDNFVINSYLNGEKHSYNAYIDPSQIGQISKLSVEKTDEADGVEIVIPVKDGDFDEFKTKAINLFKYFKPKPIVHGLQSNHEWKAIIENDNKDALFSTDDWSWLDVNNDRYSRGDAIAIMGNIGYPIDEYALNLADDDYELKRLLCENLILHVPLGELEISASREKLQYTEYTRKNLIKRLKQAQNELAEQIGERFKGCKTLFEARCLYGATFRTDSPLYRLKDVIKSLLKYNGEVVDSSAFTTYNSQGVDLRSFKKSYRSSKYKPDENSRIECDSGTIVIENDVGHRRGVMGKMLPLIITQGKTPYLIQFESYLDSDTSKMVTAKKAKANWLKESKFDGDIVKLSSLPQHKLSEFGYSTGGGTGSYGSKDEKHSAKCFEFDFDNDCSRWERKKANWWKIADVDVDNESGVYVIIDKFHIEQPNNTNGYEQHHDPATLTSWKTAFEEIGLKFPKNIYAFKVKERQKIEGKDGWTDLFTWVKNQLKQIIEDEHLHQAWIDIQKVDELHRHNQGYRYNRAKDDVYTDEGVFHTFNKLNLIVPMGTLGSFVEKYNAMKQDNQTHKKIKAIQEVASTFGVEFSSPKGVKPSHDLLGELIQVFDKYDMFYIVDTNKWRHDQTKEDRLRLENYVNVIDICEKSKS